MRPMPSHIVDFELDPEGDWIAVLSCGHTRHVRHDPPWRNRPWVTTLAGRASKLGFELDCRACERGGPEPERSGNPRTPA